MATISFTKLAQEIWRAYVTDGVPASGIHKPSKSEIRQYGLDVETNVGNINTELVALGATVAPLDRAMRRNAAIVAQTGFATNTYVAGSTVTLPNTGRVAGMRYQAKLYVSKTAAGVASPVVRVLVGTNGSIADTSLASLTFAAQTAVADSGRIDIDVVFRAVGGGTSAIIQSQGVLFHGLATTGLSTDPTSFRATTSGGFNSTTADLKIGLALDAGASAAWTLNSVIATLDGLA